MLKSEQRDNSCLLLPHTHTQTWTLSGQLRYQGQLRLLSQSPRKTSKNVRNTFSYGFCGFKKKIFLEKVSLGKTVQMLSYWRPHISFVPSQMTAAMVSHSIPYSHVNCLHCNLVEDISSSLFWMSKLVQLDNCDIHFCFLGTHLHPLWETHWSCLSHYHGPLKQVFV